MIWRHTCLTFAPALALLGLLMVGWREVEDIACYIPALLGCAALLTLIPLGISCCVWLTAEERKIPHPYTVILPLTPLAIVLLWPVGVSNALRFPHSCEVTIYEDVPTSRPALYGKGNAAFSCSATGPGNPDDFTFTSAFLHYQGRATEDLYIRLPEWQAHFTNTYTTDFPLNRDGILEFVRRNDDFPEEEAEAITDRLWELLNKYAEKRDLPPMVERGTAPTYPPFSYHVPRPSAFRATVVIVAPILLGLSVVLAGLYSRMVRNRNTLPSVTNAEGVIQTSAPKPSAGAYRPAHW